MASGVWPGGVWSAGRRVASAGLVSVACGVLRAGAACGPVRASRCVLWCVASGGCRSGAWIINSNVQACGVWRVTVVSRSRACGVSRWRVAVACGVWRRAACHSGVWRHWRRACRTVASLVASGVSESRWRVSCGPVEKWLVASHWRDSEPEACGLSSRVTVVFCSGVWPTNRVETGETLLSFSILLLVLSTSIFFSLVLSFTHYLSQSHGVVLAVAVGSPTCSQ